MKKIFFFIFFVLTLLSCETENKVSSSQDNSKWVMAYYVGYQDGPAQQGKSQQKPSEINYSYLTHIAVGIALAQNDGSLDLKFYHSSETEGKNWAKEVIKLAHQYKRKALLMVGGEGNGDEIKASMQNYKEKFISSLVNTVKDLNFDGIDLDWEDYIDDTLFVELVKELRKRLPDKLLTVPGFPININISNIPDRIAQIAPYIDQYNIMSYYPGCVWIGNGWKSWHNSPLMGEKANTPVSIAKSLELLHKKGVPKEKLGMGISFYGFGYTGGITAPDQDTDWSKNEFWGGDNTFPSWKLFNTDGLELQKKYRKWDDKAKNPYLSLPQDKALVDANGKTCQYISYDDEESILAKGRFARENGYGGVIIWTISQGHIAENPPDKKDPLLKAAYEAFILGK